MPAIEVNWREDSTATVYGRIMAQDGSGLPIVGQGRCLKQADIDTITFSTFDVSDPGSPINTGDVDVSESVFDTLQTSSNDPAWNKSLGFNFRHTLGPENFPSGNRVYTVEYKVTTTGGTVGFLIYRGTAEAIFSS